jgi:hypothetical protein
MQRIRQSVAATLSVTFTDELGLPQARAGGVTVGVTRADGTVVIASGTAASAGASTGVFTKALLASQTAQLDRLTAVWHDVTNNVDVTTYHKVVGGFLFTITEAREYDDSIDDAADFPNQLIASRREDTENELEWICDRAFVPSYDRVIVDGDGTNLLQIGKHDLRRVRGISIYRDGLDGTATALTSTELSALGLLPGGLIRRTDGNIFDFGVANVIVDVEYGLDGLTVDGTLVAAAIERMISRIVMPKSGMPNRTKAWTDPNGNRYEFAGPDAYRTGIDSIDAVYARFSKRARPDDDANGGGPVTMVPASRTLSYDPQWGSLFRGGPR